MHKQRSLGAKISIGAVIGFILLAVINGIIGNQAYVLFVWLWSQVKNLITTNLWPWILTLVMFLILLGFVFLWWHNSRALSVELRAKELELDTKNKQLDIQNKVVSELEARISAFTQSDKLLGDRVHTGISRVIPQTVHFDWLPDLNTAKNVTMIKLRHNFSENPDYYKAFEKVVLARGGSVTLVMADPRSPAIWQRYKEEPTSLLSGSNLDETKWVRGLEDLAEILHRLDDWRQRLVREGCDISKLSIKVSGHYPTQAFYKFDNAIYFHDYPYLERGFHAPTFLFTNPATPVHQFLSRCIQSVVNDSLPLEDVIDEIWKRYQAGLLSDRQVLKSRIIVTTSA